MKPLIPDLNEIVERLSALYSSEESERWLGSKHPLLKGERAIDLIKAGRGAEVITVIDSLDAAAYT